MQCILLVAKLHFFKKQWVDKHKYKVDKACRQRHFHRLCLVASLTFASNTQKKKTALRMYTQRTVACKCVFYLQF